MVPRERVKWATMGRSRFEYETGLDEDDHMNMRCTPDDKSCMSGLTWSCGTKWR